MTWRLGRGGLASSERETEREEPDIDLGCDVHDPVAIGHTPETVAPVEAVGGDHPGAGVDERR